MRRAPLVVSALLILTSCTTVANLKATPLKDQSAAQIQSDRKRCDEWAKKTTNALTGFAACLIAAGYETTPRVESTSQTLRLGQPSTATEPTRVLLDVLDCESQARREAERDLGMITRWIKENLVSWKSNTGKRRQIFVDCTKARGYEVGKG